MILAGGRFQVFVATKPVDFRKGMDSLAAVVQERLRLDPFSGAVFVFRAKRADRVKLLGLDIKMFYGGPKEAIMHGIYRQNMGYTHIIIGRKHADAPYADGGPIWGDFDAQEIFGKLNGELLIQPVKVGFAAYYESAGRVDLMELHKDEKPVFISGKDVRNTLLKGELVDPRIMRPSTSRILAAAMKG